MARICLHHSSRYFLITDGQVKHVFDLGAIFEGIKATNLSLLHPPLQCCESSSSAPSLPWPSVVRAYQGLHRTNSANPTGKKSIQSSMEISYTAKVVQIFRAKYGVPVVGSTVVITTPSNSAACGVDWLRIGNQYLLNGRTQAQLDMSLCAQIEAVEWTAVSPDVRGALQNGTFEPCSKECH
uniref:NTR domain-containing protein n=1 Tax=Steinernema glaseri TaxID=37863 RepID=A0A1I7Y6M8_9BILA